jgi:ferritin-like metal-binding protein YciE
MLNIFSSETFNTLEDFFKHELKDLYDAEHRLLDALPKMADKAKSPALKAAFKEHLEETRGQVERLERCFSICDYEAERVTCPAMKGLISEGSEVLNAGGDADVIDAALIAAAQRVEHYEIAGYGSARTHAEALGKRDVARLLQETLDEEGNADHKLTSLAEAGVNQRALNA